MLAEVGTRKVKTTAMKSRYGSVVPYQPEQDYLLSYEQWNLGP